MFCLRSWLPLLFIPTNASPLFILLFFVSTYFLNRPCVYCSVLLLILFISSCHWSDHCFFSPSSLSSTGNGVMDWFEPRRLSSAFPNPIAGNGMRSLSADSVHNATVVVEALKGTAGAVAGAAVEEVRRRLGEVRTTGWIGGWEWLRSGLAKREWRVPCVDVWIRL